MVEQTERQRSRLSCLSGLGEEQQQKTAVAKTSKIWEETDEETGCDPNDACPSFNAFYIFVFYRIIMHL